VFEAEPIDPDDLLLELDNLILLPHSVDGMEELHLGNCRGTGQTVLDLFRGHAPQHIANKEILKRPEMKHKLRRYAGRSP